MAVAAGIVGELRAARARRASDHLPLILDLDGTLLLSDLLLESAIAYLKRNPLGIVLMVLWAFQGPAVLKQRLAERTDVAVDLLPEHGPLVDYARAADAAGRPVYLATAANHAFGDALRRRYPFLRDVLASTEGVNLKGRRKAAGLEQRFPGGYVYAGDTAADMPVWRSAAGRVFAGEDVAVERRMARLGPVEASLPRARPGLKVWARALRLHQWAKNALVFVAPVLGGKIDDPAAWIACAVGFLAIGVIASATYLINDLLDLEDDRRHWSKRLRPLAAGTLPLKDALVFAPLALIVGFALAAIAGGLAGVAMAGVYCAGTLAYSFRLKRAPILDVFMLAGLFTLRLAFGVVLAQVAPSPWLLVFSMFLFASLALAKRSTEIERGRRQGDKWIGGRGYLVADAPLVGSLGGATAVAAVLVMVLYLIEEAFNKALYHSPQLLWGLPVVLGLWLGRVWLLCGRGELADDPVAFAVKDRMSLGLGAVLMGCFVGAVV